MSVIPFNPLKIGDKIAIVAPTGNGNYITDEIRDAAVKTLASIGLECIFYPTTFAPLQMTLEDRQQRGRDINKAFADPSVAGILSIIGGFASVHTFDHIDFDLIRQNPKLFCGFSDITVMHSALFSKAGLISISGPHFASFAFPKEIDYTLQQFKKLAFHESDIITYTASQHCSHEHWFTPETQKNFVPNTGIKIIREGITKGRLIGGNLSSQILLSGTDYFKVPLNEDLILFIEDDSDSTLPVFDRMLYNLLETVGAQNIKGILIGRFEADSGITEENLHQILSYRPFLKEIPILADIDFGHTAPLTSIPYGGFASLTTSETQAIIQFSQRRF
jgi:muramoyltetrapeptide carboxypeptidase